MAKCGSEAEEDFGSDRGKTYQDPPYLLVLVRKQHPACLWIASVLLFAQLFRVPESFSIERVGFLDNGKRDAIINKAKY